MPLSLSCTGAARVSQAARISSFQLVPGWNAGIAAIRLKVVQQVGRMKFRTTIKRHYLGIAIGHVVPR